MAKRQTDADNRLSERLAGLQAPVAGGAATRETLSPALAEPNDRLVAAAAGYAGDGYQPNSAFGSRSSSAAVAASGGTPS